MNWLDIILLIPILWGLYKGFTKGLVVEAGTMIALIGGIYCAINFSNYVSDYLRNHYGWNSEYLHAMSLALTFILVVILVIIVARLITAGVNAASLTPINKILGAVFGALKFAFIFSILIFFIHALEKNFVLISETAKSRSFLYYYVERIAPLIIPGLRAGF